jgi:hypothetical protein
MESRMRRSAAVEARERIRKVAELSQRIRAQHVEHNRLHSSAMNIPVRPRTKLDYDPDEAAELRRIEREELEKYGDFIADSSDEESDEVVDSSSEEESAESEEGEDSSEEDLNEEELRSLLEPDDEEEEVDLNDYSVVSSKPSEIIFRYNTAPSSSSSSEVSKVVTEQKPQIKSEDLTAQTTSLQDETKEESELPPNATDLAAQTQQ